MERRRLGTSELFVTPITMGCWPITGMSSLDVNEADSLATLEAAIECGINSFDTAYGYGMQGESERMIAQVLGQRRDQFVIATKGGIHWGPGKQRILDGTAKRLRFECEESLRRLNTDRIDLLFLHAPDPEIPIEQSAGELQRLMDEGKTRYVGVSNCTVPQMEAFAQECPIAACQVHYNLLQREIEADVLPWCVERGIGITAYWPLLKGLLAGKLPRDFVFRPGDGRAKYPMFQGQEWQKNQDLLDELRPIAQQAGLTVAQLSIRWVADQKGISTALCGAKRPDQIRENAVAGEKQLSETTLAAIDAAMQRRGNPDSRPAV